QSNYADIEKVIGIWIITEEIPKELQNTATRYYLNKEDYIGITDEPKEDYDLMEIIMIRRGEYPDITEPLFEYLKSVYDADIATIDKYTPVSANPELREEVSTMPGMSQVIFNQGFSQGMSEGMTQGISQGIAQGISQGAEEKHKNDIKQLADYFMKENTEMTLEQATEMAEKILK
ncbi:MAG: hypothetical protein IJT16_13250, partial [Lachnospiraceae bacterium]|nr:hypothetical protein [Lachnospiraceae bacterium]